jgi:hypothetical protein
MAFIKRRRVQSACSISLREMLSLSSLSTPWVARKLYTNIANFSPQQVLLSHPVSWQRAFRHAPLNQPGCARGEAQLYVQVALPKM